MPQLQPVVVTDRATPTAVDRTLTPEGLDIRTGVASLVGEGGTPLRRPRLTIVSKKGDGTVRVKLTFVRPVVQDATGSDGVIRDVKLRSHSAFLDFVFADSSTETERNNFIGEVFSLGLPSKTLVNDTLVKLQGIY